MVATSSRTFGGPREFTTFSTHLSWTSCRPSVCVNCKCNVFVCPHTPRLSGLLSGSEWKKAAKASVNAPLLSHMTIVFDHNFKKESKTQKHVFLICFLIKIINIEHKYCIYSNSGELRFRTKDIFSNPSLHVKQDHFSVLVEFVSVDFYLLPRSVNEVWPLILYIHWYSAGGKPTFI